MNIKKEAVSLLKVSENPPVFIKKLESMLKSNSKKGYEVKKFVPGAGKTFGAPVPVLKELGTAIGKAGEKEPKKYMDLLKRMWKRGYREGRIIAVFALERIGIKEPSGSLKLIESFIPGITNWEVCDQLAMRGLKPLIYADSEKIVSLSKKSAKSKKKWVRRFGAASLIPFAHSKHEINQSFFDVLEPLMADKDSDVKKAVAWALRELTKKSPELVFRFILRWTKKTDKNVTWIIKNGMKKLEKQKQDKILSMLDGTKNRISQ